MEEQSAEFLASVFPGLDPAMPLHEMIKDGVLLCRLVHILDAEFQMKVDKRKIAFVYGANLENFINYCKSINIPNSFLPAPLSIVNNDPEAIKGVCSVLWLIHKYAGIGEWESEQGAETLINLNEFEDIALKKIQFNPKEQEVFADVAPAPEQESQALEEGSEEKKDEEIKVQLAMEEQKRIDAELKEIERIQKGELERKEQEELIRKLKEELARKEQEEDESKEEEELARKEQEEEIKEEEVEKEEQKRIEEEQSLLWEQEQQEQREEEIIRLEKAEQARKEVEAQEAAASAAEAEKMEEYKQEVTDKSCYEKQNLEIIYFDEPNYQLYPTFKSDIVIIGAAGCGKTTLGMRIHQGHCRYTPQEVPQAYELTYLHQADNWPANIHLVIRETEEDKYMRECNFVFLCFSFNDMRSFKALPKYFKLIDKYGNPDVIMIGLKADDRLPQITEDMIEKMLDEQKKSRQNSLRYHSISALKGFGVKGLLDGLEFYMNREEEIVRK